MIHNSLSFLVREWNHQKIEYLSMIYKATDIHEGVSIQKYINGILKLFTKLLAENYAALNNLGFVVPIAANNDWIPELLIFIRARQVKLWEKISLRQIYLHYRVSPDIADCLECYQGLLALSRNKMMKRLDKFSIEVQHTVILLIQIQFHFEEPWLNTKERNRHLNKIRFLNERLYRHENDRQISHSQ